MDWADEAADEILYYLFKCSSAGERRELIAAYLRRERSQGAMIGVRDVGKAMGVPVSAND